MKQYIPGVAILIVLLAAGAASAATETVRDDFEIISYENNDGSVDWDGDWIEIGENDGADTATVLVTSGGGGGYLRIKQSNVGAFRRANLPEAGTATLSLEYRRVQLLDATQYFTLEISADGGGSWTELDRFEGPGTDPSAVATSYDISAYASYGTTIRFLSSSGVEGLAQLSVYFVEIEYDAGVIDVEQTVEDRFDSRSYSNDDGSVAWTSDWIEVGENDGPLVGKLKVSNGGLLRVGKSGRSIGRQADLSSAVTAHLVLNYYRSGLDNANDYVAVDISDDGGLNFTELDRLEGPGTDESPQSVIYDISGYAATDTVVRFRSSSALGANERVKFDVVRLAYETP